MRRSRWTCVALCAVVAWAACASAPAKIGEPRLREVLGYLADDARLGRDTPSQGQDDAAEYLAAQFAAAGLQPGAADGTFFHRYTRPGLAFATADLRATVRSGEQEVTLAPGADVRLWRASGAFAVDDGEVLRLDSATADRDEMRGAGRNPVLFEVDADSPLWAACGSERRLVLGGRSRGGSPWLLVRRGVLPAGAVRATVRIAEPQRVDVPLRNVVAVFPGSERPAEIVLLSAHYDHIGVGVPVHGDPIYNGADDDGTGTTAVLAIAEALAHGARLPRTVAFACFSGEERGLLGSRAFASEPPFPLENVVADLNLEMLGRPWRPATAWMTGRTLSDLESRVRPGLARAGVECGVFDQEAALFWASDNASLVAEGVVAHSISASSLHADYHQPSDEVGKIDFANLTKVVQGILEATRDLASAADRPTYTEEARAQLSTRGQR